MFTRTRTSPGPNAGHKQHAHAVIGFQIIDIGLKTCGISDANASMRACLERYDCTGCVAVGVERARLMLSGGYRALGFQPALAVAAHRRGRVEDSTVTIIVAGGRWRTILAMTLPSYCR